MAALEIPFAKGTGHEIRLNTILFVREVVNLVDPKLNRLVNHIYTGNRRVAKKNAARVWRAVRDAGYDLSGKRDGNDEMCVSLIRSRDGAPVLSLAVAVELYRGKFTVALAIIRHTEGVNVVEQMECYSEA